jgi:hypothetical protein
MNLLRRTACHTNFDGFAYLKSGKYLRSIEGPEIPHAIFVREDRMAQFPSIGPNLPLIDHAFWRI